jgi:Leucine-rich repeat (LRR) protein
MYFSMDPRGQTGITEDDLVKKARTNDPSLKAFTHYYSPISDFSFLRGNTYISYLDLTGNSITDVSFLAENNTITFLILSENTITDISFLKGNNTIDYLFH